MQSNRPAAVIVCTAAVRAVKPVAEHLKTGMP